MIIIKLKKIIFVLGLIVILATSVFAQPAELPKPGITPDSPFYFLDTLFDGLQSPEAVVDEKAAEVVAMAQQNKVRALEKARERYERAMEKRNRNAQGNEEEAENVARQASTHLEVLARVREQVPEEALQGIDTAIENSARGRENALKALNETNPERGKQVAEETLQRVMENAPEAALPGLQRALDAVRSGGHPAMESGETGGMPSREREGKPNETMGPPENVSGQPEDSRQPEEAGQMAENKP